MLALLALVAPAASARAADIPNVTDPVYFQTQGPNALITRGDYYSASTSQGGAGSDHLITFATPMYWPATGKPLTVSIYDPESSGGKLTTGLPAYDEITGAADATTFWVVQKLASGTTSTLNTKNYPSGTTATNGKWDQIVTFNPVAGATYEIHATSSDNDDNAWRARVTYDPDCAVGAATCTAAQLDNGNQVDNLDGVSGTGDEILLRPVRVAYQHDVSPQSCSNIYFFVDESLMSVSARNFDLDGSGSVLYTRPDGSKVTGTVSANGNWATDSVAVNGSANYGWWRAQFCATPTNLYIFEPPAAIPSYMVLPGAPKIEVAKTDGVTTAQWGQTLNYTINVANTSNLNVNPGTAVGVVVRDTIPAGLAYSGCSMGGVVGTCTQSSGVVTWTLTDPVAAGRSVALGLSTTVNSGSSGTVLNTAVADYNDVYGNNYPDASGSDAADTIQPPTFVFTKTSSANGALVNASSLLTYTLQIQNPTTSGHTNVTVADALPVGTEYVPGSTVVTLSTDPVGVTRTNATGGALSSGIPPTLVTAGDSISLAAGATMIVTYSVNVTSPIATASQRYIVNTATVTSTQDTVGKQASVTDELDREPILDVVESGPVSALVGDTATYGFAVSHVASSDGSPVSAVTISDDVTGTPTYVSGDDGDGLLENGETWIYTADYTILAGDPRPLVDTVTVGGTDLNGQAIPAATDNHSVSVAVPSASISLVKATTDTLTAGATIHYLLTATNTGNVTLTGVQISDDLKGAVLDGECRAATLAPAESVTCTFTYLASQGDVDSGGLTNSAAVVGTPPAGDDVTDTASVTLNASPLPAITLTEVADVTDFAVGDTVTYTLTARNTGNVTLTGVQISEQLKGATLVGTCDAATLAPGALTSCVYTYVAQQDDGDAGTLVNPASVVGTPPVGDDVADTASVELPGTDAPAIGVVVTVDSRDYFKAGDVLRFTVVTTNTGPIALQHATLAATLAGADTSDCDALDNTLASGASMTCAVTYVITEPDMARTEVLLSVVAQGESATAVRASAVGDSNSVPVVALAFTGYDADAQARNAGLLVLGGLGLIALARRRLRDGES